MVSYVSPLCHEPTDFYLVFDLVLSLTFFLLYFFNLYEMAGAGEIPISKEPGGGDFRDVTAIFALASKGVHNTI
jgi:hypothetical protein